MVVIKSHGVIVVPMIAALRHLTRTVCALLIVISLGISMVETALCDVPLGDGLVYGVDAGATPTAGASTDPSVPVPPAGGTGYCCCIHTFPDRASGNPAVIAVIASFPVLTPHAAQFLTSHSAAPLVPPPIA